MTVDTPVADLHGVGKALAAKYAILGIHTVAELIEYYPRSYDDYSNVTPVNKLKPGAVSIKVDIKQATGRYVRRGMHITEAIASDDTGSVRLVWFNQPYRANALKSNEQYYISGQYQLSRQRFAISNPSIELVSDFPINTARILSVYRETKGLTSRQIRLALEQVLPIINQLTYPLPPSLAQQLQLISHAEALRWLHFPESATQLELARRRLGFEEVFYLSVASLLNKQANQSDRAPAIEFKPPVAQKFVKALPFTLTNEQRTVIWQIFIDLQKSVPMNRLLEGDVGSGKTVVAAIAALMAIDQGWQVALMAPTELLARQHADTVYELLKPLHVESKVGLLVGSQTVAQKKAGRESIAQGTTQFVIGTQALIQEMVDMHSLALVVIDEQHRFGVDQRRALMAKAGHMPHVLSLTATPIPRSLALTLYGELDVSILASKPPGRQPIKTSLVSPNSRAQSLAEVELELNRGRQVFVVCPLIAESSNLDATSAEKVYEKIMTGPWKKYRVGLLHGKLKAADKQAVMEQFVAHKLDILVTTTVIEVGVDVPNASVMIIESPERFGLAQIHQLRGRVGRGSEPGFCYLMLSDSSSPSRRLRALESSQDGFKLAELDLEIRGPGAIYGTMQHGAIDLRIASLSDTKLIAEARNAASAFLDTNPNLLEYKELMQHVNRLRAVTNLN